MAQTYVTQANDTLWGIAEKFYGDGNRFQEIYQANQATIGSDPNVIYGGMTLTIPDSNSGFQTYTTTDDDTLWSIAEKFYGDGTRYPDIYAVNQSVIGPDPNVLRGGLTLSIPTGVVS